MMHREAFQWFNRPFNGAVKLALYYTTNGKCLPLKAQQFTNTIRAHVGKLQPVTGINPKELSACSLRAGGATALLTGGVNHKVIKLLGRWKSDAMMDYLHQQFLPVFR